MDRSRDPVMRKSDWNAWAAGSRDVEVKRLEQELAESRARKIRARHEAAQTRDRFELLLEASRRFTRTLSDRRRQQQTSRQYLVVQHAIDGVLAEADSIEDAARGVLKTLGENLGWQVAALWVPSGETLRCIEVWHRPDVAPEGFAEACRRTSFMRGEGLPGRAWAENRPVWTGDPPRDERFVEETISSKRRLRGALAFRITGGGEPRGVIELLGSNVLHSGNELLYTAGLIGGRLGQFANRRRDEERLRLATEVGRVGLLDWDVLADERRCSGAMAEIYGYPPGEFNLSYEEFLERVHPDDRGRVRSTLDAAVAAGAPYELEFRIVRPAGDIRWVHAKGRVHRNEKGVFARMLGVSLDVTEKKQAQEERDRLLSMELRRPETEIGLVAALQDLLEVVVPDDISVELSTSGAESRLSDHQRGQLYLILREAVRNAVKHSGCGSLTVGLDITSEEVSGYVEDDGCGFEGNGETRGGLGLRSIRERAALLEGTAEVYSSQKGGAGIQVCLPLRNGGG